MQPASRHDQYVGAGGNSGRRGTPCGQAAAGSNVRTTTGRSRARLMGISDRLRWVWSKVSGRPAGVKDDPASRNSFRNESPHVALELLAIAAPQDLRVPYPFRNGYIRSGPRDGMAMAARDLGLARGVASCYPYRSSSGCCTRVGSPHSFFWEKGTETGRGARSRPRRRPAGDRQPGLRARGRRA